MVLTRRELVNLTQFASKSRVVCGIAPFFVALPVASPRPGHGQLPVDTPRGWRYMETRNTNLVSTVYG